MLNGRDDGSAATLPPVQTPTVALVQPPPAAPPTAAPPTQPVTSNAETLAQAESAVRALIAQGLTPGQALAQHPLPNGTSTADALAFLATLPQSVTPIGDVNAGVITGPPIAELAGDGDYGEPISDPTAYDGWLFDPVFPAGGNVESMDNSPRLLRGAAFVTATRKHCAARSIDPLAAFANAMAEGISGAIGDNGTAYGAWQIHATDGRLPQFDAQPLYSPIVQAWTWTDNGIDYAIRSMVAGGAKGLRGHAAVHAIVYGFERPLDEAGAYTLRAHNYDLLLAKGSNADAYLASLAGGPSLTSTPAGGNYDPGSITKTKPVTNTKTVTVWKDLMQFLARDAPFAAQHAKALADEFVPALK